MIFVAINIPSVPLHEVDAARTLYYSHLPPMLATARDRSLVQSYLLL